MNKDVPKIFLFTCFLSILLVILFLSVSVSLLKKRESNVVYVDRIIRDTTYLSIRDTLTITKFKTIEKTVSSDTVYIRSNDTIFLPVPMYDYHFKEDGLYDIEAYGYNVKLNKVEVYPTTKIVTITQYIEKEDGRRKEKEDWDAYIKGGLEVFNGGCIPNIGLMLKTPKKASFGANMGYFNGDMTFGIEVGYKFF